MSASPDSPEPNLAYRRGGGHDGARHLQSFASLYDLNRQIIALLVDVADRTPSDRIWLGWRTLGNELARLDAARREGLAHCPFSLVDVRLCDSPSSSHSDHVLNEPAQGQLPFSSVLLESRLEHLAHTACVFAWHLVRTDLIAARLVFAMDSDSSSYMAQVTLTAVRRMAREQVHNGRVQPRWHNRPDVWFRLIETATSPHRDAFATVTTRGLQLFLQELMHGT